MFKYHFTFSEPIYIDMSVSNGIVTLTNTPLLDSILGLGSYQRQQTMGKKKKVFNRHNIVNRRRVGT